MDRPPHVSPKLHVALCVSPKLHVALCAHVSRVQLLVGGRWVLGLAALDERGRVRRRRRRALRGRWGRRVLWRRRGGADVGEQPARRRRRRKLRVAGAGASPGGVDRALPRGAGGPPAHPTPQPFAGAARAMRPQMRPQRDPGRTRRHVHAGQVFIQLLPDWRDPRCPTTDRIRLLGLDLDVPTVPRPRAPAPRRASCRLRVGFVLVLCRVGAGALTGRGATAGAEAAVLGDTPGADGAPGRLCV